MHDTLRATVAASLLTRPPVASLPAALHEMAGSTGSGAHGARNASQAFDRLQQLAGFDGGVPGVWNTGHPVWATPGGGMSGLPATLARYARLARAGAAAGQQWRAA